MRFLDRLERVFGRFALPHLSLLIVIGQVGVFFAEYFGRLSPLTILYAPVLVTQGGEWWRLGTFLLEPPRPGFFGIVFIAFAWWMFFMMGSALEEYWGDFRFNLFLFTGYLLTVAVSFLQPEGYVDNAFLYGTIFLAFAYINPDFEMVLFFILPVKVRWLALIAWAGYAYEVVRGPWPVRLQVLAAIGNVLLFFGKDILFGMAASRRRMNRQAKRMVESAKEAPRHTCRICGKTNLTDPEMDFRYCSKCEGDDCYCPEHLQNHEHTQAAPKAP